MTVKTNNVAKYLYLLTFCSSMNFDNGFHSLLRRNNKCFLSSKSTY